MASMSGRAEPLRVGQERMRSATGTQARAARLDSPSRSSMPSSERNGRAAPEIGAYHSVHPAKERPNLTPVHWHPGASRAARVRVRAYTCDCLPVVFELCVAGGLAFVRRHERSIGRLVVVESEWETWRRTEELWIAILRGEAG
ncbi:hypothetical protein OUY22_00635 [Nonomuraea sp. MCN248]|uniref:Uncharacterized protein n=1 Tax=Nonomuraea corallina TaxID=2989783 RepID=A0ABT4S3Y3_9ACTN|nr:hypothetical protein [Nonomuraea corallina]MDA0631907.1 hypothetical protein [Nonomuraea corallina]